MTMIKELLKDTRDEIFHFNKTGIHLQWSTMKQLDQKTTTVGAKYKKYKIPDYLPPTGAPCKILPGRVHVHGYDDLNQAHLDDPEEHFEEVMWSDETKL